MLEQRIQQQFYDSADLKVQSAELLARPIHAAATAVLGAITAGGKVLAWGHGASFADAQRIVAALVGRFERDRPALAALTLGADATVLQAAATLSPSGTDPAALAARQLQALGVSGDVLVLLVAELPVALAGLRGLVEAAHDKDMTVLLLTGRDAEPLAAGLSEADVHLPVNHERTIRVQEVHTLALHCICDAVDLQLMGEDELT